MERSLLRAAYLDAEYGVWLDGQPVVFTFSRTRFARAPSPLAGIAEPWAIITAFNPRSHVCTEPVNRMRDQRLRRMLVDLHAGQLPAVSQDRSGNWHEIGMLLPSCDVNRVLTLARTFDQQALVWADHGRIGLLDCQTCSWTVRTVRPVDNSESSRPTVI